MKRQSYIEQSTVFETVPKPDGYESLGALNKHYMRQSAKGIYDSDRGRGDPHETAKQKSAISAARECDYYLRQEAEERTSARCGAKSKRSGEPCQLRPIEGKTRCKYHGGASTGPQTLAGRIKAISGLRQYKTNPEALQRRIGAMRIEFEVGDKVSLGGWVKSLKQTPQDTITSHTI